MKHSADDIQKRFLEWKNIENQLEELFKIRDKKETVILMDKGFALFYEALFLVNKKELSSHVVSISELVLKPINVEERMNFIQVRHGSFHSFKQLVELFKELEKQYAKKASLENI